MLKYIVCVRMCEFWVFSTLRSIFQMCYDCLIQNLYYQAWCGKSAQPRDIDKHSCAQNIGTVYKYKFWLHLLRKSGGEARQKGSDEIYILHNREFSVVKLLLSVLVIHLWCCFTERGFFSCGMSRGMKELSKRAPHNIQFREGIKMYKYEQYVQPKLKTVTASHK
jgi:hypothetical protein